MRSQSTAGTCGRPCDGDGNKKVANWVSAPLPLPPPLPLPTLLEIPRSPPKRKKSGSSRGARALTTLLDPATHCVAAEVEGKGRTPRGTSGGRDETRRFVTSIDEMATS